MFIIRSPQVYIYIYIAIILSTLKFLPIFSRGGKLVVDGTETNIEVPPTQNQNNKITKQMVVSDKSIYLYKYQAESKCISKGKGDKEYANFLNNQQS